MSTHAPPYQFLRFLGVGLLNTAFGYGCYALLLLAGAHYAVALLIATVLGVLFNFKTTGSLVFRSSDNRLLGRFMAAYGGLYLLNVAGVHALESLDANAFAAGAIMLPVMALIAYPVNKFLVFRSMRGGRPNR